MISHKISGSGTKLLGENTFSKTCYSWSMPKTTPKWKLYQLSIIYCFKHCSVMLHSKTPLKLIHSICDSFLSKLFHMNLSQPKVKYEVVWEKPDCGDLWLVMIQMRLHIRLVYWSHQFASMENERSIEASLICHILQCEIKSHRI